MEVYTIWVELRYNCNGQSDGGSYAYPVNTDANDYLSVDNWASDWSGDSNHPYGGVAWSSICNYHSGICYYAAIPVYTTGLTFQGDLAEWILERPTVGGSIAQIANFQETWMYGAWALDWNNNGNYVTYSQGTPTYQWTMKYAGRSYTNGQVIWSPGYLATAYSGNADGAGQDIEWVWDNYDPQYCPLYANGYPNCPN